MGSFRHQRPSAQRHVKKELRDMPKRSGFIERMRGPTRGSTPRRLDKIKSPAPQKKERAKSIENWPAPVGVQRNDHVTSQRDAVPKLEGRQLQTRPRPERGAEGENEAQETKKGRRSSPVSKPSLGLNLPLHPKLQSCSKGVLGSEATWCFPP